MGDQFEQTDRFKQGLSIRREVLGDTYVDKALEGVRETFFVEETSADISRSITHYKSHTSNTLPRNGQSGVVPD